MPPVSSTDMRETEASRNERLGAIPQFGTRRPWTWVGCKAVVSPVGPSKNNLRRQRRRASSVQRPRSIATARCLEKQPSDLSCCDSVAKDTVIAKVVNSGSYKKKTKYHTAAYYCKYFLSLVREIMEGGNLSSTPCDQRQPLTIEVLLQDLVAETLNVLHAKGQSIR